MTDLTPDEQYTLLCATPLLERAEQLVQNATAAGALNKLVQDAGVDQAGPIAFAPSPFPGSEAEQLAAAFEPVTKERAVAVLQLVYAELFDEPAKSELTALMQEMDIQIPSPPPPAPRGLIPRL